jgi:hypothetical protein
VDHYSVQEFHGKVYLFAYQITVNTTHKDAMEGLCQCLPGHPQPMLNTMIDAVTTNYGKPPSVHIVYVTTKRNLTLRRQSDGNEIHTNVPHPSDNKQVVAQLCILMQGLPRSQKFTHSEVTVPGRKDISVSHYVWCDILCQSTASLYRGAQKEQLLNSKIILRVRGYGRCRPTYGEEKSLLFFKKKKKWRSRLLLLLFFV